MWSAAASDAIVYFGQYADQWTNIWNEQENK